MLLPNFLKIPMFLLAYSKAKVASPISLPGSWIAAAPGNPLLKSLLFWPMAIEKRSLWSFITATFESLDNPRPLKSFLQMKEKALSILLSCCVGLIATLGFQIRVQSLWWPPQIGLMIVSTKFAPFLMTLDKKALESSHLHHLLSILIGVSWSRNSVG